MLLWFFTTDFRFALGGKKKNQPRRVGTRESAAASLQAVARVGLGFPLAVLLDVRASVLLGGPRTRVRPDPGKAWFRVTSRCLTLFVKLPGDVCAEKVTKGRKHLDIFSSETSFIFG